MTARRGVRAGGPILILFMGLVLAPLDVTAATGPAHLVVEAALMAPVTSTTNQEGHEVARGEDKSPWSGGLHGPRFEYDVGPTPHVAADESNPETPAPRSSSNSPALAGGERVARDGRASIAAGGVLENAN